MSATAAGVTATLTYDPLGRLFQVVKGGANTRFVYDGDAMVAEYDGGGLLVNRYVHGTNAAADDPLLWYRGATKRYLHADHLGSIVAATNAANTPSVNSYDEYGVPAAANVGRFQYTGQIWLSELGLYHYKARLYSPSLGRFLQTDPVGYEDQINLYAYVGDDPVNASDPSGQTIDDPCIGSQFADCGGGSVNYALMNPEHAAFQKPPSTQGSSNSQLGSNDRSIAPGLIHQASGSPGGSLPAPVRPSQDQALVGAADEAAQSIPPFYNSLLGRTAFGWLRGILIHREFATIVNSMGPNYRAEVSYLRGREVPYGTPGSKRADAVVGPAGHPLFAIELKTGGAYISIDERNAYYNNLPPGTLLQQIIVP